jgi:hypothetical protein
MAPLDQHDSIAMTPAELPELVRLSPRIALPIEGSLWRLGGDD